VGSGLAGATAAFFASKNPNNIVLLVDKNTINGGNSAKATSGINAVLTSVQKKQGENDS